MHCSSRHIRMAGHCTGACGSRHGMPLSLFFAFWCAIVASLTRRTRLARSRSKPAEKDGGLIFAATSCLTELPFAALLAGSQPLPAHRLINSASHQVQAPCAAQILPGRPWLFDSTLRFLLAASGSHQLPPTRQPNLNSTHFCWRQKQTSLQFKPAIQGNPSLAGRGSDQAIPGWAATYILVLLHAPNRAIKRAPTTY